MKNLIMYGLFCLMFTVSWIDASVVDADADSSGDDTSFHPLLLDELDRLRDQSFGSTLHAEYNQLVGDFETLQERSGLTQEDFETLCGNVDTYKRKHLRALAANKLSVRDGRNSEEEENLFNTFLTRLRNFAQLKRFEVPFVLASVVRDNRGDLSSDEQDSAIPSDCSSSPRNLIKDSFRANE